MLYRAIIGALLCGALSISVAAEPDIDYSYFDVGFNRSQPDIDELAILGPVQAGDDTLDGFSLEGSVELSEAWYFWGHYSSTDSDQVLRSEIICVASPCPNTFEFERDVWGAGLGYHYPLSSRTDLVAELGYQRSEIGVIIPTEGASSKIGFSEKSEPAGALGIRSRVSERVELGARLNYSEANFNDFSISANGLFRLGDSNWWASLKIEGADDFENYIAGIRYSFD